MQPLTLEQLAALCDEIAALARAGVPLDRGLSEFAEEMPGRISRLAGELGSKIASGAPISALVAERSDIFPPAYQTVLKAGISGGSLPAALESISRSARALLELRQSIQLAWIYPYAILATAYGSIFVMMQTMPVLWQFLTQNELPLHGWEQAFAWLFQRQIYWFPWLGIGLIAGIIWDWRQRSAQHELFGVQRRFSRWASGWNAARTASQQAAFCELLALLLEHGLPLPQALRLAAEGSSANGTAGELTATCERLEKGESAALSSAPLPPLVTCVLQVAGSPQLLAEQLRRLSEHYRRQAEACVTWSGMNLQFILAFVIGVPLIVALVGMFFWPWLRVLHRLMEPILT